MSAAELNALERDVEQARARFADDLARLRSPTNLARLKNDLWADVRETKDEVVDKAKDAAQDGVQRLVAELKSRAAANPLATIAIGAGLAWRLAQRPPIATVLVGLGLIGLARTTPSQRASHPAESLADAAKEKVQDWSAQAGDAIRQTAGEIAEKAASVAESASDALEGAQQAVRETAAEVVDTTGAVAARISQTVRDTVPERDRDTAVQDRGKQAETDIYAALGLPFIEPELREEGDEIELARHLVAARSSSSIETIPSCL
jgi:hypothetical protein